MNGTGVLKVYLVQSKCYAYRLHFARAIAPEWVLENLKDLSDNIQIGFEEESQGSEDAGLEAVVEEEKQVEVFDNTYDPDPEDDEV